MNEYPRGSEWRKWDLHVHVPGTHLNDGYEGSGSLASLERFADALEASDVAVIGVTDYFDADGTLAFIEFFKQRFPESEKLLLVNVELRLNETVNRDAQMVDFHIVFRDSLSGETIKEFLSKLPTQITDANGRSKTCTGLSGKEYETASVTRADIKSTFRDVFGDKAESSDYLLYLAPSNNNGLRAELGNQRKANLADEIDKVVHGIFGKDPSNAIHFLSVDRYEDGAQASKPKPVFGGCDAHSFAELDQWLGKTLESESTRQVTTWVKADPTFAGLQQTLVEPAERVAMQATEPDQKEPYKVISKVKFSGLDHFPAEVVLNRNLNSIIGSRSSGKSSLLAHIAYAVDPDETVRLQVEAHGLGDSREAGPAAGYSWGDVADVVCQVEWESGEETSGRVIYIPQNSLHALSQQPEEITKKIAPALFRSSPIVKTVYDRALSAVVAANAEIRRAVDEWFGLAERIDERSREIEDVGDRVAIIAERDRLQGDIDRIKTAAQLTDAEVAQFQTVGTQIDGAEARIRAVSLELDQLASFVNLPSATEQASSILHSVQVSVSARPTPAEIPDSVSALIDQVKANATNELIAKIETLLVESTTQRVVERASLVVEVQRLKADNAELIEKHEANQELSSVVADHQKQVGSLEAISRLEVSRTKILQDQGAAIEQIEKSIAGRDSALSALVEEFNAEDRLLTDLKFGVETGMPVELLLHVSAGFSQRSTNDYIKSKGALVSYEDARSAPAAFLSALRLGKVALNKNYEANVVAADVLGLTDEIRFSAELDSDRIGGFSRSSMTPGKQALFALTLILNESQEPWPLLIDQPEDDLDSRSIYDTIVPYLVARKKERQIIMVSHNANLVIGADSEQVIVANRHGEDRKNKRGQTFEYFTGSLEHSQPLNDSSGTALGRFGVREHACEILDGGEEAFKKRRNKYKI